MAEEIAFDDARASCRASSRRVPKVRPSYPLSAVLKCGVCQGSIGDLGDAEKTRIVWLALRGGDRLFARLRRQRLVFVSGTTGFDYATITISDDIVAQCEQAMRNVELALGEAGAAMSDIVRVRYILPRREDFECCWPILKKYLGDTRPAATMMQAGLSDPRMLFEIEVTARRSPPRAG